MADQLAAPPKKLTPKQRAFINAYFECNMNASAAARKAGYTNRANTAASQLMSNDVIAAEIERIRRENTMPASEVLLRLTEHARGDLGDFVDNTGTIDWVSVRELGRTGLLKKIKRKTRREITKDGGETETIDEEIELHNPQVALQLLGKYHGLFVDKMEHSGKDGGPIEYVKTYIGISPDDWDEQPSSA